jgi:D-xylose transport system permease protein
VAGFIGAVCAVLQVRYHLGTVPTILVALVLGGVVGAWHGYWIAYRGVSALIVTLGSMMAFKGALIGVTGGATVGPMNDSFKAIGQGYLPHILSGNDGMNDSTFLVGLFAMAAILVLRIRGRKARKQYGFPVQSMPAFVLGTGLLALGAGAVFVVLGLYRGLSWPVVIVMGLALLFNFIATGTTFGRRIFAIGGNTEAAMLSGINTRRHTLFVYVLMGFMTAVAGIIFTARLNAAAATAGNLFELDAIAAVVIGGTSLSGGVGNVPGALVGALVMGSLDNGMSLMDMDVTYQYILKGIILLVAVWVDTMTRKKPGK